MLYVKLNDQKVAVEFPKSYKEISKEHAAKNNFLPIESVFASKADEFGYGLVPISPKPEQIAGKTIIPDIPTKNEDGTYQRTWKYVDSAEAAGLDINQMDQLMKIKRKTYLEKFADSVSALRWNSWTAEQQQEVTDWYQSVLDMTNDPAWPYVHFPILPNPLK